MALNLEKLEEAQEKLSKVQKVASRINEILVRVSEVILGDDEGNPIVSLTTDQKNSLKEEYGKAKIALDDAVAQLP